MNHLTWHYGVYREQVPKSRFRWRDLKDQAQRLDCDYVSVIHGAEHYWLGFATTVGVDAAAAIKVLASTDKTVGNATHILYLEFSYGYYHCVHWQAEQLRCCQSMDLNGILEYLQEFPWSEQTYIWLHLQSSDPVRQQVQALNPVAQTRILQNTPVLGKATPVFLPISKARALRSPLRAWYWPASAAVVLLATMLWWQSNNQTVAPLPPAIDLDAKRYELIAEQGLEPAQLSQVGALIDIALQVPGWELQQVVLNSRAKGFIWLRLAPSFGELAALRRELAHLPLQWQFESHGVILHYPLEAPTAGASSAASRQALVRQLPLSLATQVEWLLGTVPIYVKNSSVQVATAQPLAYELQSRPIVLSLKSAYSQDLDAMLGLLRVLPVRVQAMELRFQGQQLDGEITATLFNHSEALTTEV